MSNFIPVGIDLGTSFCAVSFIDADGRSQMIPSANGEILTPSVVLFGDDEIVVGRTAWDAAIQSPDRVAENAKRDMGLATYRQQIGGENYPPEVIQSCILRHLRRDISAAIGEDNQAVITVPAYFDEARRQATFDAAIMSGLSVLDIVNEPTAAALSFGERLGYLTPDGTPRECLNLLVYDLGGGTFDVTVIRLAANEIRALATDGDYELGGVNWDLRLAEFAESKLHALRPTGSPLERVERIQLLRSARDAKHALTDQPLATIRLSRADQEFKLPITRDEFEELTSDLLERTVFTTRQALQAAGLIWSEIDRLLLVGGSSRMPAVKRILEKTSGIIVEAAVNPDEAVARGAAIYAHYLLGQRGIEAQTPKLRITDVNSHSLGIEGVNLGTLQTENVAIIPRNTALPCEIKRTFVTRTDNQPNARIQLLEGESSLPSHCSRLATATIKNLPAGLPKGTPIDVRYRLQSNGRLVVTASISGHGVDAVIELQRVRGLADRRIQRWKKVICRDGGYRDYEEALSNLIASDPIEACSFVDNDDDTAKSDSKSIRDLEPAFDFGAPQAAAEALKKYLYSSETNIPEPFACAHEVATDALPLEDTLPRSQFRHNGAAHRGITKAVGILVGGIVGIVLGYYLLSLVRPDVNWFDRAPATTSRAGEQSN